MTSKLTPEEGKAIRTAWIKSIFLESAGYFSMNHYAMQLALAYGDDVGGEFKKKVRKMQREERRKLSVEEVIAIYKDFESDLNR